MDGLKEHDYFDYLDLEHQRCWIMFSQRSIMDKIYFSTRRKAEEEEGREEGGKKNYSESKDENIHGFNIFFL